MAALGDKPAAKITPADVESVSANGRRHRRLSPQREPGARDRLCRVQLRDEADDVRAPDDPALGTDRRRVPEPGVLLFYSLEEIGSIARSLEAGFHRHRGVGS